MAPKKPTPKKSNAPLGKLSTKKELDARDKELFGKGAMKDGSLSIDQKMARNARERKQNQKLQTERARAADKKATPSKPGTTGSRKITVTASSRKVENKTVKPGSMATQSKIVDVKPSKKPSTKYSPAPMSAAAKAKIRATARKPKAGSSIVSKVVGRAKTVAREVRDIPTAVGTVIRAPKPKAGTNTPSNKQPRYAKYDLKNQIKEVKDAITSGKKGTGAVLYGKGKTEYRNQPKKK